MSPRHRAPVGRPTGFDPTPTDADRELTDELEHDRRVERRVLWKALAALLIVVIIVVVRQRYLL